MSELILLLLVASFAPVLQAQHPKLSFDVASIKPNHSDEPPSSNIPVGPDDAFRNTGGVFRAINTPLIKFISFAYAVKTGQRDVFRASLPDWVLTETYNIEARTDLPNVTKDQMRLMMRTLLAERFHLAAHTEMRDSSVYAVVLVRPATLGPQLRPHPASEPCSTLAHSLAKPDPDAARSSTAPASPAKSTSCLSSFPISRPARSITATSPAPPSMKHSRLSWV